MRLNDRSHDGKRLGKTDKIGRDHADRGQTVQKLSLRLGRCSVFSQLCDKNHLQVYFDENFGAKAENIINTSGYADNLQFYAISPTDPTVQQTINLNSGGRSSAGFSAVFYAPSANFTIDGGPDITSAIVCKNFYSNGNVHWHYNRALDGQGTRSIIGSSATSKTFVRPVAPYSQRSA